MATGYLIDTSAVIKYLNGTFPEPPLEFMDDILDGSSNLSFVSEIELQVWTPENPDDLSVYKQFVANSTVKGVDDDIVTETIKVRKSH